VVGWFDYNKLSMETGSTIMELGGPVCGPRMRKHAVPMWGATNAGWRKGFVWFFGPNRMSDLRPCRTGTAFSEIKRPLKYILVWALNLKEYRHIFH
jgi:hypothetical protein